MPSIEQVKEALDTRIAIGDLTSLVTPVISNPIEYIGLIATSIAEQGLQSTEGEA